MMDAFSQQVQLNAPIYIEALANPQTTYQKKMFILENLDNWKVITMNWHQAKQPFIGNLQALAGDPKFPRKDKAALLCSKVKYCKDEYDEALEFAMASGLEFSLAPKDDKRDREYVDKMIETALDKYKRIRAEKTASASNQLDDLIDRIFKQNLENKDFTRVVGYALATRRIDMVGAAVKAANNTNILVDTLNKVWRSQLDVEFRAQVLDLIFNTFEGQGQSGASGLQNLAVRYSAMCQCLIELGRAEQVAAIFERIIDKDNALIAYQLAFDLHENAPQQFQEQIKQALFPASKSSKPEEDHATESTDKPQQSEVKQNLQRILSGDETIKHHMQFLIKNNHTDMLILRQIKDAVRGSTMHNATVIANGLMHTGTTCDDFLRENLEWISKATNWNKFNAVASLGVIHKGHEREAKKILDPYLPKGDIDQFGYKEGGSLYAYGLIHANHGNQSIIQYLTDQLSKATTSAVRHGACLGLGLAALGTRNWNVYEQLRDVLYQNEAVAGEAAGTAMGLVMAGSMNETAFSEMRQYVLDTDHDKIQRGLRTGIAMLAYGALEGAEKWIKQLEENQSEAILRQTAVCMMAMAYVGSKNADVVRRLLKYVAQDASYDVKRFAAIAIGFVCSGDPETCRNYIELEITHFHGHIRYGSAIALAIACAGTGYTESISLLEPLLQDKENYVRQGALFALSFVMIQHTATTCSNVVEFRKKITKMITEKGEDPITKFGAIIAQGILDAGGRNVTLSLQNRNEQPDMPAVLGTFVFLQNWYWHSFSYFISLAFRPTCLIGLNKDLKMPKIDFRCNAKPSQYAYPPPLEEKKKEDNGKVETAVLSITNKKKGVTAAAAAKKKSEAGTKDEKMDTDEPKPSKEDEKEKQQEEKPKELPEPSSYNLPNPARVVHNQSKALAMASNSRYAPIKPIAKGGIIMFENLKIDQEEEIVELAIAGGIGAEGEEAKGAPGKPVDAHTPFEFVFGAY